MKARRRLLRFCFLLPLIAQRGAHAQPALPNPLDVLDRLYKPLCYPDDPLGYPLRIHQLLTLGDNDQARFRFHSATPELFYLWAQTACADWLKDPATYVQCHGNPRLASTGTYCTELATDHASLALGLLDFDQASVMPFQTDLLQALISLRLQASSDGLLLTPALIESTCRDLLSGYRTALTTGLSAAELLGADPRISSLLDLPPVQARQTLRDAADRFFQAGRFKPVVRDGGKVTYLLRPALRDEDSPSAADPDAATRPARITLTGRYDRALLAAALSRAVANSPSLARRLLPRTTEDFAAALQDAALSSDLTPGPSQGLTHLLLYLTAAARAPDGATSDVLIALDEQLQYSAAQRAGYVPLTPIPGGQRVSTAASSLNPSAPTATSHVILAGRSFTLSVVNPWESRLNLRLATPEDLAFAARYLGTLLGVAHTHGAGGVENTRRLLTRTSPALKTQLVDRTNGYVSLNTQWVAQLRTDPRARTLAAEAQAWINSLTKAGQP